MDEKKDISFEELLDSLNTAIEKNSAPDKNTETPKEVKSSEESDALEGKTASFDISKLRSEKKEAHYRDHHDRVSGAFAKLKHRDVYSDGDEDDDITKKFSQLKDPDDFQIPKKEALSDNISYKEETPEDAAKKDDVLQKALGLDGSAEEAVEEKPVQHEPKVVRKKLSPDKTLSKVGSTFKDISEKAKKANEAGKKVEEYLSVEQNKKIVGRFRKESSALILRLIATGILSFLLFYVDLAPLLNVNLLPSVFMPPEYNVVFVLVQLQLLFFILLINYKTVFGGLISLLAGSPDPHSVTFITAVAVILHDIVTVLTCTRDINACVYNGVCALCVLMGLAYEYLGVKTKLSAFKVASGKTSKYVISKIPRSSAEAAVFADYSDDMRGDMYRISSAKFTSGVMSKLYSINPIEKTLKFLLPAALGVALVFFFVTIKAGGYDGYHAFTLCLMLCLPASMFIASSYPAARAQSILEQHSTAILGADGAEKLARAGIMSFNDSDVFPSTGIKVNNVNIYGDNRIDHVVYYAAGAFRKLGGPLRDVFSDTDDGVGACEQIDITELTGSGFTMIADGKTVIMGKATYLREKGFLTESTDADSKYEANSGRIMYMAYDGAIAAKFYILYTMDAEFELLLQKADSIGLYVGLRSCDPNIDDGLLAHSLNLKKYPVKVIRPDISSIGEELCDESSCPAVSRGSKGGSKALLSALMLASKMRQLRTINVIISLIAIIFSAILMILFVNAKNYTSIYGLYPILFQIIWAAISACFSNIYLQ